MALAGVVVVRAGRPLALDSCMRPVPQLMRLVCVTDVLGVVSVDSEALTDAVLIAMLGLSLTNVVGGRSFPVS